MVGSNLIVAGNTTTGRGGGIALVGGTGVSTVRLDDSFVSANIASTGGGLYVEEAGVRIRSVCPTTAFLPVDRFCSEVAANQATAFAGASAFEVNTTGALALSGWVELGRASVRDNSNSAAFGPAMWIHGPDASLLAQNVLIQGNVTADSVLVNGARIAAFHTTFGDSGAVRLDGSSIGQFNANLLHDRSAMGGSGAVIPSGVATGNCNAGVNATSITGALNANVPITYAGALGVRSLFDILPLPANNAFDRCPSGLAMDISAAVRPKYASFDRGAFEAP